MSVEEEPPDGPVARRASAYTGDRAHALRTLFPAATARRARQAPAQPAAHQPVPKPAQPTPKQPAAAQPGAVADTGTDRPGGRRRLLLLCSAGALVAVTAALLWWIPRDDPPADAPPPDPLSAVAPQVSAAAVTPPGSTGPTAPTAEATPVPPSPGPTVSTPPDRSATPAAVPPPSVPPSAPTDPTPRAGRPNPDGRNLALRRPVSPSSAEAPHFGASAAVDGDLGSRWSSAFRDPQWIAVDLGALWRIRSVTLHWEHAYAVAYRVETSADGRHWSTGYATRTGTGTVHLELSGTDARYVRMSGTTRNGQYGYSLLEFEVR
ncbi:discoidin domain-containing protein [Solwaraspora sp. WMMA2056]|uniref:discoidin domain-containing protein n=1 Tax=Solwaraspora sp. WMMA2056 TaxID=3015161 RepID=UPI00259BEBDD|nr:discoidin domain-containing protein [Solwaraspora sp. WMMA2056]WJK43457.1 discoidin domain-containing protein [Solwaraspora sp. WMMA2056]